MQELTGGFFSSKNANSEWVDGGMSVEVGGGGSDPPFKLFFGYTNWSGGECGSAKIGKNQDRKGWPKKKLKVTVEKEINSFFKEEFYVKNCGCWNSVYDFGGSLTRGK